MLHVHSTMAQQKRAESWQPLNAQRGEVNVSCHVRGCRVIDNRACIGHAEANYQITKAWPTNIGRHASSRLACSLSDIVALHARLASTGADCVTSLDQVLGVRYDFA